MVTQDFTKIYQDHSKKIYNHFLYRVGRDSDTAWDLTQETFTKALKSSSTFEDRGYSYFSYLKKVANNVLIDHYRKPRAVPLEDEILEIAASDDGFDFLDRGWIRESLNKSLKELSPVEQKVVRLRYDEDLPIKEVAKQVGKSGNAVKLILGRVKKKLAKNPALQIHKE